MIRSTKINLKSANTGKLQSLDSILEECNRVINLYIDLYWNQSNLKFAKDKVDTWLSARLQQACGKQALEIIRSVRKKKGKNTKPEYKRKSVTLDFRFVNLIFDENSFDIWIKLTSIGNKIKLFIPSKKHRHFNWYKDNDWTLKNSIRLYKNSKGYFAELFFEKEQLQKSNGETLALDNGYKKLGALSNGTFIGTDLQYYINKISNKTQGSKNFKKALIERNEYINKELKSLFQDNDIKQLIIEDLKNVKYKSKQNRKISTKFMNKLQRWVYSYIMTRLEQLAEVIGVQCLRVNPAYTSQTCSNCGAIDKNSRQGEIYKCKHCGIELDADYNASLNILNLSGQENMVPVS